MVTSPAVLVTGCSSGIGKATALALVQAGFPTWASARRVETLAELEKAGCRIVHLDVTDEESRQQAVKTIEAEHGTVGTLVNNAGYAQAGPVEEVSLDLLRRQFETNVFGLIRLCQLVLPGMRRQHSGTIVNLGSAGGLVGMPGSSAYEMTKWSLEALSDALRYEVRKFGVRVSLLEPGGVVTDFTATQTATWAEVSGPYEVFRRKHHERMARFAQQDAPGMLKPEQVAKVVVKAITARNPRARYKIGPVPRILPLIYRTMPTRVWDGLMGQLFPME